MPSSLLKNRTPENWELKRSWRNIATNERRKAIKVYWQDKANHLKSNPRECYRTFQPFINNKKQKDFQNDISIKVNGKTKVADEFAMYFATMANSIGGDHVANLSENSFHEHTSVKRIRESCSNIRHFSFRKLQSHEVLNELRGI